MITQKQIQEEKQKWIFKHHTVKNNASQNAELAYMAGVRMVLEKANLTPSCDRDCPDVEYGNCFHPSNCCKIYM